MKKFASSAASIALAVGLLGGVGVVTAAPASATIGSADWQYGSKDRCQIQAVREVARVAKMRGKVTSFIKCHYIRNGGYWGGTIRYTY